MLSKRSETITRSKNREPVPDLAALGPSLQLTSSQDVNAKHSMNPWHYPYLPIQCSFGFFLISKNHQIESSTKVSLGCFEFPHSHICPTWGWSVGTREEIDGLVLLSDTASVALRAAHSCPTTHLLTGALGFTELTHLQTVLEIRQESLISGFSLSILFKYKWKWLSVSLVYPGSMGETTTTEFCGVQSSAGENLDVIRLRLVAQALEGSASPKGFLPKMFLICYSNPLISQEICLRGITLSTRNGFVILMFAHNGPGKHFLSLSGHFWIIWRWFQS